MTVIINCNSCYINTIYNQRYSNIKTMNVSVIQCLLLMFISLFTVCHVAMVMYTFTLLNFFHISKFLLLNANDTTHHTPFIYLFCWYPFLTHTLIKT